MTKIRSLPYLVIDSLRVENSFCLKLTENMRRVGGEDDLHGDEILDDDRDVVMLEEVGPGEVSTR